MIIFNTCWLFYIKSIELKEQEKEKQCMAAKGGMQGKG